MSLRMSLLAVDIAVIGVIAVVIALLMMRPERHVLVPGFVLMGVGCIGALLCDTLVIPRKYWLHAQVVTVPVRILGFVLILRAWRKH
jgi:hypothetical protein